MLTDYKFWYITQQDDNQIVECAVRFFEGEINTKDEFIGDRIESVTAYRRSKKLDPNKMNHVKHKRMKKDAGGNDCVIYDVNDFGVITTREELKAFMNLELKKDKDRTSISYQSV